MITIERAKAEDAVEYTKVKVNAFQKEVELYGSGPTGYDSLEEQIKGIQEHYCYKILEDGKLIGGMGVVDRGEGHFHLAFIFVDLECQSKGIGTLAMEFLESEFPKAKKWSLDTPYLSYRNHHFYEKLGFVKIGETEPMTENNGFYLFLYEKIIK